MTLARYSLQLGSKVCDRIAAGESFSSIFSKVNESTPTRRTWNSWLRQHAELRALEIEAIVVVDSNVEIAGDPNRKCWRSHLQG